MLRTITFISFSLIDCYLMGIWRGNIESISDDCRKRRCQLHRHFYFSHGAWYSNNFQSYPSSLGRHNCSSWSWESTSTFLPNRSHRIHPLPFPSLTIQAEFSPFPPPPSPPPPHSHPPSLPPNRLRWNPPLLSHNNRSSRVQPTPTSFPPPNRLRRNQPFPSLTHRSSRV